ADHLHIRYAGNGCLQPPLYDRMIVGNQDTNQPTWAHHFVLNAVGRDNRCCRTHSDQEDYLMSSSILSYPVGLLQLYRWIDIALYRWIDIPRAPVKRLPQGSYTRAVNVETRPKRPVSDPPHLSHVAPFVTTATWRRLSATQAHRIPDASAAHI